MIKVGICNHNVVLASAVKQLLNNLGNNKLVVLDIDVFSSGDELCKSLKAGTRYDIIYLEVEMKRLNGIETAKILRQFDPDVLLIYLSSYEKHLTELIETEPFGFLKIPLQDNAFEKCFNRALAKIEKEDLYFEYKFNKTRSKVPMGNIMYFESSGRIINIIMKDGIEKYYNKLNQLEKVLEHSKFSFIRIHQSYLVNYRYIEKIGLTKLKLTNGVELQISEDRRKNILLQYSKLVE